MIGDTGVKIEQFIECFQYENIIDFNFQSAKASRLVISSTVMKEATFGWDWIGNFQNRILIIMIESTEP